MTENESFVVSAAAGATLVLGAVAVVSIVKLKHQVHTLDNSLHCKEEVVKVWKRNFEKAVDLLPASALLELHKVIETDMKFEKIIIDNL